MSSGNICILPSGSKCVPLAVESVDDVYTTDNGAFFLLDSNKNIKAWFEVPTGAATRLYTITDGSLFRELLILNRKSKPLVRMVGHNGKIFQYRFEG